MDILVTRVRIHESLPDRLIGETKNGRRGLSPELTPDTRPSISGDERSMSSRKRRRACLNFREAQPTMTTTCTLTLVLWTGVRGSESGSISTTFYRLRRGGPRVEEKADERAKIFRQAGGATGGTQAVNCGAEVEANGKAKVEETR